MSSTWLFCHIERMNKGFAPILILVPIFLLLILTITGIYILFGNIPSFISYVRYPHTEDRIITPPFPSSTTNWKTYSNDIYNLNYPPDWFLSSFESQVKISSFNLGLSSLPPKDTAFVDISLQDVPIDRQQNYFDDLISVNSKKIMRGSSRWKIGTYNALSLDHSTSGNEVKAIDLFAAFPNGQVVVATLRYVKESDLDIILQILSTFEFIK